MPSGDGRRVCGFERPAELADRVVEAGSYRAVRDAQDLGDLAERQADEVVEHDDDAMVVAERVKGSAQLVAQREIPISIAGFGGVLRVRSTMVTPIRRWRRASAWQ